MKNVFTPLLFIGLFLSSSLVKAQSPFTFANANAKFVSAAFHSGNSVSVVDMDGDGMDDIARLGQSNDLYYTIQRTNQTFNNIHAVSTGTGSAWAMIVGDVNNDGVRDVAVGYNGSAKLVTGNSSLTTFPIVTLPSSNFFLQNMNFADINNDGWIDLFGCNDVGTSANWRNNGAGAYPSTSSLISPTNFASAGSSGPYDNSGNYGSIWTDVNNDGHVDLYIAHCRQGTSANCVNRLDELYINDGNNNYAIDTAIAPNGRGLRDYHMTWTSSFDDIDNDGDLDCILTQTDVSSQLFLNDGNGYFTEATSGSGFVVDVTPYQSKMEDLDNDGFIDIIISGDDSRIFHNNHNHTFTRIDNLFDGNHMLSFATGDLNHDGKIDLYSTYGTVYNNPTTTNDVLWMNTTNNGNHFVTINLQGTISNRDALGARVEIYGAWGKQIREVRSGESYGTTNSFMCHFGLGTATSVDSVIVRWPKGLVTHLYNRPADQFITIIEGQCSSPDNLIAFNGPSVLCAGQSVTMSAPAGYAYLWSTGDTTQSISTATLGDFTVRVKDNASGCSSISKMATILLQPDETPTIIAAGQTTFCEGVGVVLQGSAAASYLWSNGATTQNITVNQPGNYSLTIQGSCAAFTSQPISVTPITSHVSNVIPASTCENNLTPLTLQATGTGDTYWYDSLSAGTLLGTGNSYTTPAVTNSTTYYVESRDTILGQSGEVGPANNTIGTGGYSNGYNFFQVFNVLKPIVLKTVLVYANSAKNRTIELRNSTGTLIQSATINIAQGTQTITLNFSIPVGNGYQLGWSGTAPDLYRNNAGAVYPYTIANLISITGNTYSNQTYWYAYYNWQVEEQPIACTSIRVPVTATVNSLPSATITAGGATSFCDGGSVSLTAAQNTSYLWSDNSTSQSLNASQSGTYSVTVTSAANCSNSSSVSVTKYAAVDATVTSNKPTSICNGDNVTLSAPAGQNYAWSNNTTLQSITVSSNGTFTVTVTDANSCSAVSLPVTVTVSNNAVAGVTTSGATKFCEGGSVQLTAANGTAYLWSNNETTPDITISASGTFTVTVTASGSCVAISNPIVVEVNPNPVVSMSGLNSQYLSTDATVTLTGTPAGGTFTGTGVTADSFDPATAGVGGPYVITYSYTDSNSCSAVTTSNVTVTLGTGLSELEGISKVSVSPNPSNGQIQLSLLSNGLKNLEIAVVNSIGQNVFEEKNIAVNNIYSRPMNLESAAKGIYQLIITSGKKQNTYKLVIQ